MKNHGRKSRSLLACSLPIFISAIVSLSAKAETVLSNVPPYALYDGCAPTSRAMVLAYWDLTYGDTNLFTVQGSSLYTETNVEPAIDSIASDCGTVSGITLGGNVGPGLVSYAASEGYVFQASLTRDSLATTWNLLVNEINAGRPMLFYWTLPVVGSLTISYQYLDTTAIIFSLMDLLARLTRATLPMLEMKLQFGKSFKAKRSVTYMEFTRKFRLFPRNPFRNQRLLFFLLRPSYHWFFAG